MWKNKRQGILLISWLIIQFGLTCIRSVDEQKHDVHDGDIQFLSENGRLLIRYGNKTVNPDNFMRTKRSTIWMNPYENVQQVQQSRHVRTLPRSPLYTSDVAAPTEYQTTLKRPLMIEEGEESKAHLLRPEKCIPIKIPLCQKIGYNLTYMPNAFHHETQEEAGLEVHQFFPLVEINCSEDLRLFLCSLYTPICLPNWPYRLTACRSLCESVRDGCMPLMDFHGFKWPERMKCELFPEGNECVRRNSTTKEKQPEKTNESPPSTNKLQQQLSISMLAHELNTIYIDHLGMPSSKIAREYFEDGEVLRNMLQKILKMMIIKGEDEEESVCLPCRCRDPYLSIREPPYNEVMTGGVEGCLPSCHDPAFHSRSDHTFTTFWLGLWSVLCILSTLTTITTFLADPDRFQYPERPIIYLSACYFMVALGYMIRVVIGHESIACDGAMLRRGSTGPAQCSIVFLLTFVFGMASSVWWVILTLTWFLAAGLKWGSEAIANYSQLYHFLAWFFPGLQAILVLIISAIDGDAVGGLCSVSSTNLTYLYLFVLSPMCIYLGLGTIFLIAGFVALFKIRSVIKLQSRGQLKADKLEKLMIRIGIFGVLYTVPTTVVIGCIWYEVLNRESWNRMHNCPCISLHGFTTNWMQRVLDKATVYLQNMDKQSDLRVRRSIPTIIQPNLSTSYSDQPKYAVFMLKYFMSLVVGITSGFWIWSSKTLDSWRSCFHRLTNNSNHPHPVRNTKCNAFNTNLNTITTFQPVNTQAQGNCSSPWAVGHNGSAWNSKAVHAGSSCTTWPEEFAPTTRLLPQPPTSSFSMSCNHAPGISATQPNGQILTTGLSQSTTGNRQSTDTTFLNCSSLLEGNGNLKMVTSSPMTHV